MIMPFLLLSFVSLNASEVSSLIAIADPFVNFGKNTHRIVHSDYFVTEYTVFSDQIIIKDAYNNIFFKLDKDGMQVDQMTANTTSSTLWEACQVYWDTTTFVVPTDTGLQRYHYSDFSLDVSFGDQGTVANPIAGETVLFTTVTKNGNYYYAGGFYHNIEHDNYNITLIARFTLDGQLDRLFNANSTPGYFEFQQLNNGTLQTQPLQILFLQDSIIVRLHEAQLISFPLDGPYISQHFLSSFPMECNLELDPLNPNSFFAASPNGLYLFTSTLEQDTTFNTTGNIPLPAIFSDYQIVRPWALKKVNNKIFIAGYSLDANGNDRGFVVCYNISNRKSPTIDTSFFRTGYLLLDKTIYPITTIYKILFDSSNPVPALFLCAPFQIARLTLEENFMRSNLVSKTLSQRLLFDEANTLLSRNISLI